MGAFSPIHWLIILAVVAVPASLAWLLARRKKGASAGDPPRHFNDPARLTGVLQFLLVAMMAICVISALSEIAQYQMLQSRFTHAEATTNDARQHIIARLHILTFFIQLLDLSDERECSGARRRSYEGYARLDGRLAVRPDCLSLEAL